VKPAPGFASDAGFHDSVEEDGVIDTVKGLLNVKEEDGALYGANCWF
jgi:hypothetical protein